MSPHNLPADGVGDGADRGTYTPPEPGRRDYTPGQSGRFTHAVITGFVISAAIYITALTILAVWAVTR